MNITVKQRHDQHSVELFGGRLRENKPLAGAPLYSNLLYWAHVEAPEEGTFPMHPHEGLEILTFIFEGGLEHYDTATEKWTPLPAGGVQQIQSGKGVYHSEKYIKGSRAFQIWFDPDFSKALKKEADYEDFQTDRFEWEAIENGRIMRYAGTNAPIHTDAPGISASRYLLQPGTHQLKTDIDTIYSIYVMNGGASIEGNHIEKDGFAVVEEADGFSIDCKVDSEIFVLESPKTVSYARIADR